MSKQPRIKVTSAQDITFTEVYEQFQIFNKARNLSPQTLRFYEQTHTAVLKFMSGNFVINTFDEQTLYRFINHLRDDRGNKPMTINTHLRSLRAMFNFASERGYMEHFTIKAIKVDAQVMPTYTEEELKILLRKPDMNKINFSDYRNWVIISFLIGTGARASTVCNIKIKDLDISASEVIFRHMKTRKQIVVPISSTLKGTLMQYLKVRGGTDDDYLFCECRGTMLTPNALKFAIKRYNLRRGIVKTGIHMFRHTFAKMFIVAGGNAFVLQRLLGHADIKMTMKYVSLFGNDLANNYDMYNPLENLTDKRQYIRVKK